MLRQAPVNAFMYDFARASVIRGNGPDRRNRTRSNSTIISFSFTIVVAVNFGIPFLRTSRNISRSGNTFPNPVECG